MKICLTLMNRSRLAAAFLAILSCQITPKATAADSGPGFAPVQFPGTSDTLTWRNPAGEWMTAAAVSLDPKDPSKLVMAAGEGILVNGPKGRTLDLMTSQEFGDLQVHVEFCIPNQSNSGVYLMGRYEIQIYDSYGVSKDKYPGIECGGIYPRWTSERNEFEGHSPRVNASSPPGQWHAFDITFRAPRFDASGKKIANARFVKVVHNGQVIHENVAVNGPTRSAHFESEAATGPLLLQGDHGPVAYRNLKASAIHLP